MALRISDLGTAPTVEETDLVEIAEVDGESPSGYSSYKTTILGIANKIATSTAFSGLVTTAKNIVGSINEVDGLLDLKESKADMEEDVTEILEDLSDDVTVTGNPVTFETINGGMAKSCEVAFSPVQSGSGDPSPTNIRPISGWDGLNLMRTGKNVFDGDFPNIGSLAQYIEIKVGDGSFTMSTTCPKNENNAANLFFTNSTSTPSTDTNGVWNGQSRTVTANNGKVYLWYRKTPQTNPESYNTQVEKGVSPTEYEEYNGQTYTATFEETIYGGNYDFVSGEGSETWGYIAEYDGETLPGVWISDRDVYAPNTTPSTGAEVAYQLATPTPIELTAEQIELLKGTNVISTDGDSITLVASKLANVPDLLTYIQSLEARIKALEEA